MRPVYETAADLKREHSVKSVLEQVWNIEVRKLPNRYFVDWCFFRDNKLTAFAEFKRRHHNHDKYSTVMLPYLKWVQGMMLAKDASVPLLIIMQFDDGMYWDLSPSAAEIGWGGRKDRNDPEDQELYVFMPIAKFIKFKLEPKNV